MSKTTTHKSVCAGCPAKGFLAFCVAMFAASFLFAQAPEKLLVALAQTNAPNEKIDLMTKLAGQYANSKDYLRAMEYIAMAMKFREANSANPYVNSRRFDSYGEKIFKPYSEEKLKLAIQSLPQQVECASFYNFAADFVSENYSSDYAVELAEKAALLAKANNLPHQLGSAHFIMGGVYYVQHKLALAETHFLNALEQFQHLKDTLELMQTKRYLGRVNKWLYKLDKAEQYHRQALALAQALKNQGEEIGCLSKLREIYAWRGNYKEVKKLGDVIMAKIEQLPSNREETLESEMSHRALLLADMGNFKEALPIYQKTVAALEKAKSFNGLENKYCTLGDCYWGLGKYDSSLVYYQKALQLGREFHDNYAIGFALSKMYEVFFDLGDREAAMACAKEMEAYLSKIEKADGDNYLSSALRWKIIYFEKLGQLDTAIFYAKAKIDNVIQQGISSELPDLYLRLGDFYQRQGRYDDARSNFQLGLEQALKIGLDGATSRSFFFLAKLAVEQNNFETAIDYATRSLKMAEALHLKAFMPELYETLSKAYSGVGDYKMAYRYQIELSSLKDSLMGFAQHQQAAKAAAQLRLREKEVTIKSLQLDKAQQEFIIRKRNSLISALALLVLIVTAGAYLYKEQAKLLAENKLRRTITRDIHDDVGGILNNLKLTAKEALEQKNDPEFVEKKLQQTVLLGTQAMESLKNLIWSLDSKKVHLDELVDEIRTLAHEMLSSHQIPFQFDIKRMEGRHMVTPRAHHHLLMICKEALQNAVKHGDHQNIAIHLSQNDDAIFFSVKNGIAKSKPSEKGTEKGLSNMQERASLLDGRIEIKQEEDFFELLVQAKI